MPIKQPTDKTAHADADQKLADEAKGPGERLATSARIDRLGWGAPRLYLIEPLANRVGASAKCLGLLGADFATSRAGPFPSDDMAFTGPIAGSRPP